MFASARRTYESGTKAAPSGRELEAAALFKAARQIEACRRDLEHQERGEPLDDALRFNQRLWTFFQAELGAPDCPLPVEMRRNLLHISGFVDRRTFEMLARPTPDGLQALIDINRNIATGLSAQVEPVEHVRTA